MIKEQNLQIAETPQLLIHGVSRCPSINFFNVDCIEFMKSKPDKCYDLAIVDPPYGVNITGQFENANKKGSKSMFKQTKGIVKKGWDNEIPTQEYFTELKRVSKNQVIWGGQLLFRLFGEYKVYANMG